MVCKLSAVLQRLALFGWMLQQLWAQDELVIQPPGPAAAALGSNITFSCSGNGSIVWQIRNTQVRIADRQEAFRNSLIFVPLPQDDESEMTVTATIANNETDLTIMCLLIIGTPLETPIRSNTVTLRVFAAPSPPTNLSISLPPQGREVTLSWLPGFALEGEEVTYVITSLDLAGGTPMETRVNINSIGLTPSEAIGGRMCQMFRFTVQSENAFSRSNSSISDETVVPTVPFRLEKEDIMMSVSLLNQSSVVNISFDAPSPCPQFGVQDYIFCFFEVINDEVESTPFVNFAEKTNASSVSVTVDELLLGREYQLIITAFNSAGSTNSSPITTLTVGLQSSLVIIDATLSTANISCTFATGSMSLGCEISFGSLTFTIKRDLVDDVAMDTVALPDNLLPEDLAMVTVAEVLPDGTLGSIAIEADVTMILPTTLATSSPSLPSSSTDSGGSLMFIIIGVAIGAVIIVILLLIIMMIICIVCNSRRMKLRLHRQVNEEELKPNYVYGAPPRPTFIESTNLVLDSTRAVRSNTYDDYRPEGQDGGGATPGVPTYETIELAKKNALAVGGTPVLNPVYGPSGIPNTPNTPISPHSQAVKNPVYAETKTNPLEASCVSGMNPVYASPGKDVPQPSLTSPGKTPQYAYAAVGGRTFSFPGKDVPQRSFTEPAKLPPQYSYAHVGGKTLSPTSTPQPSATDPGTTPQYAYASVGDGNGSPAVLSTDKLASQAGLTSADPGMKPQYVNSSGEPGSHSPGGGARDVAQPDRYVNAGESTVPHYASTNGPVKEGYMNIGQSTVPHYATPTSANGAVKQKADPESTQPSGAIPAYEVLKPIKRSDSWLESFEDPTTISGLMKAGPGVTSSTTKQSSEYEELKPIRQSEDLTSSGDNNMGDIRTVLTENTSYGVIEVIERASRQNTPQSTLPETAEAAAQKRTSSHMENGKL